MQSTADTWSQLSVPPDSLLDSSKPSNVPKKPRHRHTPAQLAALNELYEKSEHPTLEQRISLAERLGMETKTVNAWFQNKRASSKKRSRNHQSIDAHPIVMPMVSSAPSSASSLSHVPELDDYHDDEISLLDMNRTHLVPDLAGQYHHTPRHSGNGDASQFFTEAESVPRRMRDRTAHKHTDEHKKIYSVDAHPSTELRQVLSERLGMGYQTVTNWFQSRRSSGKRRHDHLDADASLQSDYPSESHYLTYSSALSPSSSNDRTLPYHGRNSSADYSLYTEEPTFRRMSSRRYSTPYGTTSAFSRPRRSRPEPYQLDALKELFTKTPTPSIEERSALAAAVGMDLDRVTNWFRNLRQTARKRARKTGSSEDDDDSIPSGLLRPATPSQHSTSSANEDGMELDDHDGELHHSDIGSDEEYQEAITPSPEPITAAPSASKSDMASDSTLDKISLTRYHGVKIEDALLLLSFHQHVAQ